MLRPIDVQEPKQKVGSKHRLRCIVTADALNGQRAIAAKVIEQGADYVLSLKGNQGTLHDDVRLFFEETQRPACQDAMQNSAGDRRRTWPRVTANIVKIILYAMTCGAGLARYLDNGSIDIDMNTIDRAIRPQNDHTPERFVRGVQRDRTWATIVTLLTTAKPNIPGLNLPLSASLLSDEARASMLTSIGPQRS